MVCRCMCRLVVDENEERTEQVFVHRGRRRGWGERVEGGRGEGGGGGRKLGGGGAEPTSETVSIDICN